jgi:hypothetical protein
MPFEIVWESRGVCRRYFGTLLAAEIQRSIEMICEDARFDDLRYCICDYRDVTRVGSSGEELAVATAQLRGATRTNPNIIAAVVATQPAMLAGLNALPLLQSGPNPSAVFATPDEAHAWIATQRHA